jgi:putative endonuclease
LYVEDLKRGSNPADKGGRPKDSFEMGSNYLMHDWYVYIVRCRDGSLYTGIATDVERRIVDHLANKGAKYLRGRGPLKLVFKKQVGKKGRDIKKRRSLRPAPALKRYSVTIAAELQSRRAINLN